MYRPVDVSVRVVGLLVWIKVFLNGSQQHPRVDSQHADKRRLDDVMTRLQQQRHSGEHAHDAILFAAVEVVNNEEDAELTAVETRHELDDVGDLVNLPTSTRFDFEQVS